LDRTGFLPSWCKRVASLRLTSSIAFDTCVIMWNLPNTFNACGVCS
jgi:hypothetical protein